MTLLTAMQIAKLGFGIQALEKTSKLKFSAGVLIAQICPKII